MGTLKKQFQRIVFPSCSLVSTKLKTLYLQSDEIMPLKLNLPSGYPKEAVLKDRFQQLQLGVNKIENPVPSK